MTNHNNRNAKTPTPPSKPNPPAAGTSSKTAAFNPGRLDSQTLPKTWDDIQVGSLVIAQEGLKYGWWEAIVTNITGDVLKLRWRDYPDQTAPDRRRHQVALVFAGK